MPVSKKKESTTESILKRVTRIEKKINKLTSLEKVLSEDKKEKELSSFENKQQLSELAKLEKELESDIHQKPITKITSRDFVKSVIGATFGVIGHFSFYDGVAISHEISVLKATLLLFVSLLIGIALMYFSGFRSIKSKQALQMMPLRISVIYFTSLLTAFVILLLFQHDYETFTYVSLYKSIATNSILAVMGAATADLIGKND